jgi:hypothetical protein
MSRDSRLIPQALGGPGDSLTSSVVDDWPSLMPTDAVGAHHQGERAEIPSVAARGQFRFAPSPFGIQKSFPVLVAPPTHHYISNEHGRFWPISPSKGHRCSLASVVGRMLPFCHLTWQNGWQNWRIAIGDGRIWQNQIIVVL